MASCPNYGIFSGKQRFAMDQVPLELDNCAYTLNDSGSKSVYIKGARKAQNQRRATLQVCMRVEGEQIVPLTLIMQSHKISPARRSGIYVILK